MTTYDISGALGLPQPAVDEKLEFISIDSRQISFPRLTLFVALVTKQRNGHQFIEAAYNTGVRHFLVEAGPQGVKYPGAIFFEVPNTLVALQQLVAWHRGNFNIPVIGITGSNGKTIVKEWLAQLLEPGFSICRSPRSYNSQIGVPLSVWQLGPNHNLGIFEAGISTPGEMEKLEKIIRPTIGIFTTLGSAHDDGFSSRAQKLEEKWKLFKGCGAIIYHCDDEALQGIAEKKQSRIHWLGAK